MRVTVRIRVSGRVQGVSFRAMLQAHALRHGVDGWVRNQDDGSVEALLQGEDTAVERVVDWSRRGPPRANVTYLERETLSSHPAQSGFDILG